MTRQRPPQRPREPAPDECCGSGCARCVWDVYYDKLAAYEAAMREYRANNNNNDSSNNNNNDDDDEDSDDDETSDASSDGDATAAVRDHVGSLVVRFVDEGGSVTHDADDDDDDATARLLCDVLPTFAPVRDVTLVRSSSGSSGSCACHDGGPMCVLELALSRRVARPQPGDVVEVLVPNCGCHKACSSSNNGKDDGVQRGDCVVARVCARLQVAPATRCVLQRSALVAEGCTPPWLPLHRTLTVRQLLTFIVDVNGSSYVLHRGFFAGLLRAYERDARNRALGDDADAHVADKVALLRACASPDSGPRILRAAQTMCYATLADVLDVFAFVRLPLARLLELCSPLRPRQYSVVAAYAHAATTSSTSTDTNNDEDGDECEGDACERDECERVQLCVRQVVQSRRRGNTAALLTRSNSDHDDDDDDNDDGARATSSSLSRTTAAAARQLACWLNDVASWHTPCTVAVTDTRCDGGDGCFRGHVSYPLCARALLSSHHGQSASAAADNDNDNVRTTLYMSAKRGCRSSFATALQHAIHAVATEHTTAATTAAAVTVAACVTVPRVLLVSAGTGVAPMAAAVHALRRRRRAATSSCSSRLAPYRCWVLHGARCRHELLYDALMHAAQREGAVTAYTTALSREVCRGRDGDGAAAQHVTQLLAQHASVIRTSLLDAAGQMFVCGPAAMLQAVRTQLATLLLRSPHTHDTDACAAATSAVAAGAHEQQQQQQQGLSCLRELEARAQLVFDAWDHEQRL